MNYDPIPMSLQNMETTSLCTLPRSNSCHQQRQREACADKDNKNRIAGRQAGSRSEANCLGNIPDKSLTMPRKPLNLNHSEVKISLLTSLNRSLVLPFLDESSHLDERVSPSVDPLVG